MPNYVLSRKTYYKYNETNEPYEVTLLAGRYLIECIGASGGGDKGGFGARVSAVLKLLKSQVFYIYVGSAGEGFNSNNKVSKGGFNGGGNGGSGTGNLQSGSSGGGSTDFRLEKGEWNDLASLKSRVIVAGGGGGEGFGMRAGSGGRLNGVASNAWLCCNNGNCKSVSGGNQEGDVFFGFGEDGANGIDGACGSEGNGGGGGGWYGGRASRETGANSNAAGGGGSSYISGMPGCVDNEKIVFSYAIMEDGLTTKYKGNGYATITKLFPQNSRKCSQNKISYFFFVIIVSNK